MRFLIYALLDPQTKAIRYVGKSCNGLKRPNQHMTSSSLRTHSYKNSWIKSLKNQGKLPEIKVLQEFASSTHLSEAERYYIAFYKQAGVQLTNLTSGGDGICDPSPITRKRMATAKLGKKRGPHSEEHRRNMSAAIRRSRTPEFRARMSKLHGGSKVVETTTHQEFPTLREASRVLGVDSSSICKVLSGERRHTKGFQFARRA